MTVIVLILFVTAVLVLQLAPSPYLHLTVKSEHVVSVIMCTFYLHVGYLTAFSLGPFDLHRLSSYGLQSYGGRMQPRRHSARVSIPTLTGLVVGRKTQEPESVSL